jgi:O-glycosyl hydrolase
MKTHVCYGSLLAFLIAAATGVWPAAVWAAVNVTLDPAVQYQTIRGWGAASWTPPWLSTELREAGIREVVNELGLTRLRLEVPAGNGSEGGAWEQPNDDWDPLHINWPAFNTAAVDRRVTDVVLPFKTAVEANGEPFNLYVSPSLFDNGSSGAAPGWLLNNPGEYTEFALAFLLYLRDTYGIEADYYCILNEAGNNNPFNASVVAEMIKALGPRLEAAGLSTRIQFPESVNAQAAWNSYIQRVQGDDEVWRYIGCLSYHLYGTNDPYRSQIGNLGASLGLPTAQTEYMNLTMNHLYDDLTLGQVSFWEIYGLTQCLQWNLSNASFTRVGQYWSFRQVMHFVRPGAVRIGAISDDSNLRVLAFSRDDGMTVVLINGSGSRAVNLVNLPMGTYGVCQSVAGGACQELGLQAVVAGRSSAATGALPVTVPSNAVMTIYAYPGTNQPPVVTDFKATPDFLILSGPGRLPPSTTSLSASATDPERDLLSYRWSVTSRPAGANVSLAAPDSAATGAAGLTVPGEYVFAVTVGDGINTVVRNVAVNVYADNQPPFVFDVHNRLPVTVTLPTSNTQLRSAGTDLEGDPLTYRWSVLSQPVGAAALLGTPTTAACPVTNLTVAGDYIFQIEVSDPTHTVAQKLTVTVYPPNPSAPTITNAAATPATLTLPVEMTRLSAITGDPDADPLSHWWSVKSKPAGTAPAFSAQGSPNSDVTGLTLPGTYVFTLRAVDRTKVAQRDVTVTVLPAAPLRVGDAGARRSTRE